MTALDSILLGTLLAIAVASDVARRKIPNWISVTIFVTGIAVQASAGGMTGAASALLAALLVLAGGLVIWSRRLIGGGDLKLAAAVATWVGLARSPRYLLASAIAGGILAALCYLLAPREARAAIRANLYQLHAPKLPADVRAPSSKVLVPYGVAFASGAIVALYS